MGCWPVSLEEMKLLLLNKKDILFFNKKLKYTFHKSTPTTQWGSPIPFPTGGACVLSVIRFQDGGRRSAGGSVPKLEYDTNVNLCPAVVAILDFRTA